jgi:uncharacterized small protein (DUF1192 family)
MTTLTINAALRRIAALKGDIGRLEGRRASCVTYKVGELPAYKLTDLDVQVASTRAELIELKARLAVANATSKITFEGTLRPLVSCVVELQELRGQIVADEGLSHFTKPQAEFKGRETTYVSGEVQSIEVIHQCDLTTAALDSRLAVLRDRFASLNAAVEAANHTVTV